MKIKLYFLFFSIFLSISCNKIQEKSFYYENINTELIEIKNNSNKTAKFKILINNNDFSSETAIISFIKNMENEYENEPLEMKAFRFVRDFSFHENPISEINWTFSPLVLINSLGGALCGSRSAVLTNILHKLGFDARSWCIEGHVVTEVFSNNKWKVLDVDNGMYYFNNNMEIASYQELCSEEDLIINPICELIDKNDFYYSWIYSKRMADLYSSLDDNCIFNNTYSEDLENMEIIFELPANSKIKFPISEKYSTNLYSYLELTIPKSHNTKINFPFVLAGIKGKGKIKYQNQVLDIENFNIEDLLKNQENISFDYEILENENTLKLYYFINPFLFKSNDVNELKLIGENLNNIQFKQYIRNDFSFYYTRKQSPMYNLLDSLIYKNPEFINQDTSNFNADYIEYIINTLENNKTIEQNFDINKFKTEFISICELPKKYSKTDYLSYLKRENTILLLLQLLEFNKLSKENY